MTFSYDSLGLCRHWSVDTSGPIIKWHNRALLKEEFVSEWKARDLALGLQANCPVQQLRLLPPGLPHGVPIMVVALQYSNLNLLREGQEPKLCMWVLLSLWTYG